MNKIKISFTLHILDCQRVISVFIEVKQSKKGMPLCGCSYRLQIRYIDRCDLYVRLCHFIGKKSLIKMSGNHRQRINKNLIQKMVLWYLSNGT